MPTPALRAIPESESQAPSPGSERPLSSAELRRFLRFVLVGGLNTALSGLLILLLARWIAIDVAYTIVYCIGLTFMTFASARFVFRRRLTPRGAGRFVAWYLGVYLLGVTTVHLVSSGLHSSHAIATAAVLTVTVPLNFLGGRRAFGAPAGQTGR